MTIENDLQALVIGSLIGAMMGAPHLALDIEPVFDDEGNYQPWFHVTGRESDVRLKVEVTVIRPEP